MNILSRIVSIGLSIGLMILILELVRRKKLKEKYALLWLLTGFIIFILATFQNLLNWITHALGIEMPINMVFFLGIFFIILINIHLSMTISNLTEQNKKIAQKLALLEFNLSDKKKESDSGK